MKESPVFPVWDGLHRCILYIICYILYEQVCKKSKVFKKNLRETAAITCKSFSVSPQDALRRSPKDCVLRVVDNHFNKASGVHEYRLIRNDTDKKEEICKMSLD